MPRVDGMLFFLCQQGGFGLNFAPSLSTYYQCQRCTACCRWPGFVRITDVEVPRIAAYLGLSEEDFIQRFTRLTPTRSGLALLDKPNGECLYLENGGCAL